jgi:hypothetical protein
MSDLQRLINQDLKEFKAMMKHYVKEISEGKRKSKSKMNYFQSKYKYHSKENKVSGITESEYEDAMMKELSKLKEEHNNKSRIRLYVSKERISLRPVKSDVRHKVDATRKRLERKKGLYADSGNVLDVKFIEQEDKGLEMVVREGNGDDQKVYILAVDLREVQSEKKDGSVTFRIDKKKKKKFKGICSNRKLRMSDVVAQVINEIIGGKIELD